MAELLEILLNKFTTRNLIALGVTTTVLIVVLQMTFNASSMIVILKDNAELVIGGAFIFGALMAKWTDIIQFYFRKPQSKEEK